MFDDIFDDFFKILLRPFSPLYTSLYLLSFAGREDLLKIWSKWQKVVYCKVLVENFIKKILHIILMFKLYYNFVIWLLGLET